MAAVGVAEILWRGQTGKIDETGNREYTVVRAVTVDSAYDGPAVVLFAPGVGIIGQFYQIGNDVDVAAILREITPARDQEDRTKLRWLVTERYSTKAEEDKDKQKNEDGEPEDDPEKWRDELDISFRQVSRPVEKAINRTDLGKFRPKDQEGPVVNSALAVYDPPLEREQDIMVVRIVRRRKRYPADVVWARKTTINDDDFTINKPKQGLVLPVKKFQAKMPPVTGSLFYIADKKGKQKPYWKLTFEVHIDDEFGWRQDVLDRGIHARALQGDPDGRGGTLSMSASLPLGAVLNRRVTDSKGLPITEPVCLDGFGQPLTAGSPFVYLTYSIYPELPFGNRDF